MGTADAAVAAAPAETVHVVRFIIQQPGAQQVSLVGDFNGWSRDAMPLQASADASVWTLSVQLKPGRYEYAFIVDGERWIADPSSSNTVRDEFGGVASVLRLAGSDRVM
jgi:1,4-alpha-glucan branching enzyme